MEETATWLEAILNKNTYEKTISKILNINKESAVPVGANYSSVIYRVTLDVILCSGCKSKITYIFKTMHETEEKVKLIQSFSTFKRETKFYTEILSKFNQLMEDNQDNNDRLWCDLIGYKPYTTIVLQDLKGENFRMAVREKFLDKNHALLVLNSLGRFHAIGHVLMKRGLVSKEDFLPYYLVMDSPVVENMLTGGLRQLYNVMENDWPEEWKHVAKRLKAQEKVVAKKLKALFTLPEDNFETVLHGDCWTCNMMFKYCPYDDKFPVAVKFIDFQGPHISSYGFDLVYFLFISVQSEIRRTHWDEIINEYHRSLTSTLALYGIETNAPKVEQINAEIKRLEYYAFIMNIIFLPLTSADADYSFKIEYLNEDCDGMNAYNPAIFKSDRFKNSVQLEMKKWLDEGIY